jgi:hypothetical protein
MPGMAASTSETLEFGALPNVVEAPENSFELLSHLRMDFQADDDFPVAGGARNIAFRFGDADVDEGHGMLFCKLKFVCLWVEQLALGCKACRIQRHAY